MFVHPFISHYWPYSEEEISSKTQTFFRFYMQKSLGSPTKAAQAVGFFLTLHSL
jgi:hypothetical protein